MQLAIDLFAQVCGAALPFAVVFALGTKLVDTFLSMAFGGRVRF